MSKPDQEEARVKYIGATRIVANLTAEHVEHARNLQPQIDSDIRSMKTVIRYF